MFIRKSSLAGAAIAACALISTFAVSALAMTAPGSGATTSNSSTNSGVTADRLTESYSATVGSKADARALIDGMRAGRDVKIGSVTVSGTGKTMGYGSINNALALAQAQAGPTATTKDFLSALDRVTDMRARGMGWGQIAKSLGLNLGQAVSASRSHNEAAKAAHAAKPDKATSVADAGKANGRGHGGAGLGGGQGQGNGNGNGNAGGNGNAAGGGAGGNAGGGHK